MPELQVLVVDAEPADREMLGAALVKAGYSVDSAGSVAEAQAKLEETAFDVVLCEVFMPVTDGIALVRLMRERRHGVTFIMLAALASVESAIDAINAGACGYVIKPVHHDELLRRLQQIDALRSLREENRKLRRMVMCTADIDSDPAAASAAALHDQGTLRERVRRYEVSLIRRAIDEAAGDRRRAAQRLGIALSSLYRKLEETSIDP